MPSVVKPACGVSSSAFTSSWTPCRKLHPDDLSGSADKLFMYLSGYLGGPQLFIEKFGHPMLRARHMPFAIGESEADQWMLCMRAAMQECIGQDGLRINMDKALNDLAHHMRNKDDHPGMK
jgi:hemoglobin